MSLRHSSLILGLAAILALGMAGDGFARAGFGGSFGSRGSSTFSTPPSTSVSPLGGSAINRSMTSPNASVFRPNAYANAGGGFFGGGFGRGLLGGFLGAGLFGLLFGHGLFGGMDGGSSIFGLLIQIGLLFLVVKLVMGFFRNRAQPGFAGAGFSPGATSSGFSGSGFGGGGAFSGFGGGAAQREKLQIQPADFNMFEQRLSEVQTAFGQENYDGLRHIVTPEMASYFSEQLAENASKGLVNKVNAPKLIQGDLAEAWREGGSEYATVAMRFSMTDWTIERSTGRVVSGDPVKPQDVAEVWTFTRPAGASPVDWKLSAIQQAA